MRNFLWAGACVVLFAVGACTPTGPIPVTNGVPQVGADQDLADTAQSEESIMATKFGFGTLLVSGFNDDSFANTGPKEFDFTVTPPIVRRGASLMGWSTSADLGSSWEYRGKIRPPTAGPSTGGEDWSMLYGDPSMAVDPRPNMQNIGYYANLAISKAAWDSMNGGADTIPLCENPDPSSCVPPFFKAITDGVCVSQTIDGGLTFAPPFCIHIDPGNFVETTDRTAVAVDGNGNVYVSTLDTLNNPFHQRVFRTTSPGNLTTFTEIFPPFNGNIVPALRTDPFGAVWVGNFSNGQGPNINRFDQNALTWGPWLNIRDLCNGQGQPTIPPMFQDALVPMGGTAIRQNHEFDFAIGHDENHNVNIGVALLLQRPDTSRYIQLVNIELGAGSSLTCHTAQTFGTFAQGGSQIQANLNFRERTNTSPAGGTTPTWMLSYLTTQFSPDLSDKYVEVEADQVQMAAQALIFPLVLTPTSWYACPDQGYWGDYFDMTQVQDPGGGWSSVAVFSDSRPAPTPPCSVNSFGTETGHPQHVVSVRW